MPRHSIIYGTGVLVALLCALVLLRADLTEDAVRQAIRLTAATSFILLICAFSARPMFQLTHSSLAGSLLRNRRQIGISVAVSHSFHLLTILLLVPVAFDGDISQLGSLADLAPGLAVYVVLYVMAFTSNNYSQQLLGKGWKWFHTAGIYLLTLAFTGAYVGKALQFGGLDWLFSAAGLAAFIIRFAAWRRFR